MLERAKNGSLNIGVGQKSKEESAEYTRRYREMYPERYRESSLWRKYRISLNEYRAMADRQNYRCASCGHQANDVYDLHVDHDHVTGEFRGLLCKKCNNALGFLDDDIEKVEGLLRYIRRKKSYLSIWPPVTPKVARRKAYPDNVIYE